MADYERVETVEASADDLFAYLSDVGNLPDYMRRMTSAEPAGDGAVHTTAELDFGGGETRTVAGEAWFRVEAGERRMRWGAEGESSYRGELEVTGADDGAQVTVRLHTERVESDDVDRDLAETVANVKRLVEGRASDVR